MIKLLQMFNASNSSLGVLRKGLVLVVGLTLLILSAKVYIPAFPVPFTMQTLIVLILPVFMGKRLAMYNIALYCIIGLLGLEVFSPHVSGLMLLSSAQLGYIIGFVIATYIVGMMHSNISSLNKVQIVSYLLLAQYTIFACGVLWLAYVLKDLPQAILLGYVPFIIWDTLKLGIAFSVTLLAQKYID